MQSPATSPRFLSRVKSRPAPRSPFLLVVLTSLWLATVGNYALWRAVIALPDRSTAQTLKLGLGMAVIIFAATALVMGLFSWRKTVKPAVTFFLVAAAIGTYFMTSYGVVIDSTMMVNAMQTDMRETADLLSVEMLVTVLLLAVVPAVLLWRVPIRPMSFGKQTLQTAILLVASLVLTVGATLAIFPDFSSTMRNNTSLRYMINPLNSVYAAGNIAYRPFRHDTSIIDPIGRDAKLGASYENQTKPPLVVLVLGETARAGNFSLNGYDRDTNPELAKEGVVSLTNAWSCGTNTAISVPCMFSNFTRKQFGSRKTERENALDVMQHAGLAILWVDNQSGCKTVCDRVASASTTNDKDPAACGESECHDEVMLKDLDQRIAALPADKRAKGVVVVLHQMGGHGPAYSKRAPAAFKKFKPECLSNELSKCARADLINSYDNTVVYTDHFVASTIRWLKARQPDYSTAMMYVADHGESLGENNIYLHGLPYSIAPDEQKHVPWVVWLSASFQSRNKVKMGCLESHRDATASHDNYFHTILGLADVSSSVYERDMDLFSGCRAENVATAIAPSAAGAINVSAIAPIAIRPVR